MKNDRRKWEWPLQVAQGTGAGFWFGLDKTKSLAWGTSWQCLCVRCEKATEWNENGGDPALADTPKERVNEVAVVQVAPTVPKGPKIPRGPQGADEPERAWRTQEVIIIWSELMRWRCSIARRRPKPPPISWQSSTSIFEPHPKSIHTSYSYLLFKLEEA